MTKSAEIKAIVAELEAEGYPCPPELVDEIAHLEQLETLDAFDEGQAN